MLKRPEFPDGFQGKFFKGRGVSYVYLSESIRPKASGAGAGGQREELRP